MSNAIGSTRESNLSPRICHLCVVPLGHVADVSDSAGAAIASAVSKDFEVIGDDNLAEGNHRLYFETVRTAFLP